MPDTEIKPPNIPDALLKPEKWEFYDANLDAIKPNPEIHTFAQNLPLEKQIEKEKENQLREEYEFRHPDQPDPTSYNPFVKDTKIPFDFGK